MCVDPIMFPLGYEQHYIIYKIVSNVDLFLFIINIDITIDDCFCNVALADRVTRPAFVFSLKLKGTS